MRHFGVLAHSAEGAALCFLSFCREGFERLGPHRHPDISMHCTELGQSMPAWETNDIETVRAIHALTVERLKAAGADFFACPDNTSHIALEAPGPDLALPGLNIGDVVADEAARRGMTRVAILGTRFTMMGPVYPRAFGEKGIATVIPDVEERRDIDRIIFEELVAGNFTDASRAFYLDVIERLKGEGCDGVALVCTEIPLLITGETSPLPILDSTRLLARAAFNVAICASAMPDWRGGPVHRQAERRAG